VRECCRVEQVLLADVSLEEQEPAAESVGVREISVEEGNRIVRRSPGSVLA